MADSFPLWPMAEGVLEGAFRNLLKSLRPSDSREAVVLQLTRLRDDTFEEIRGVCKEVEARFQEFETAHLQSFSDIIEYWLGASFALIEKPGTQTKDLASARNVASGELAKLNGQRDEFYAQVTREFQARIAVIVNRFSDEGLSIMARGIMADTQSKNLDPAHTPKH